MIHAYALGDYRPVTSLSDYKRANAVGRSVGRKKEIVMRSSIARKTAVMQAGVSTTFGILALGSLALAAFGKGATRGLGIVMFLLAVFMLVAFERDK